MYVPSHFREEDRTRLRDLICGSPFAVLVTQIEGRPFASHLPFLLDEADGGSLVLRSHMARSNPQWRAFESGQEALVIFQGPHAYISPTWYATQPAVPTWNYAVAHLYGVPVCTDESESRSILTDTLRRFEGEESAETLPEPYFARMQQATVAFRIEVTRIEGKLKLSQNRSDEDRRLVIGRLLASPWSEDQALAALMEARQVSGTDAGG